MIKLDDATVYKLAVQLPNRRLAGKEKEEKVELPRLQYIKDFEDRAINGGPLSFMEARFLVRETLTFDKWRINFYEMVQFPQMRFFETEAEALDYYTRATVDGRMANGGKIMAQRMELYGPKDRLYGKRKIIKKWKVPGYKRDPMEFKYG
jgi:hypothetical protein